MADSPQPPPGPPAGATDLGATPLMTLIGAALFLYVGFGLGLIAFESAAPFYRFSVSAFVWMARIVGAGLILVAILEFLNRAAARPLHFVLATLATIGCVFSGGTWLFYGDTSGWLVLIFGLINATAMRSAWLNWRHR